MHQSVEDAFIAFNTPLEGRVRFMYLDAKSLVSTGIGNLLDADDPTSFGSNPRLQSYAYQLGWFDKDSQAVASADEIDQEYQTVKFSGTAMLPIDQKEHITRVRITDAAIDDLVLTHLRDNESSLLNRSEFADLGSWPADAQLGLFSMAWAMGTGFRFPNFQRAAASGDWLTMAAECRMKESDNPGVIPRNVRNQLLFTIASWVAAPEPGDFSALVFDTSVSLADNMRSARFPIPVRLGIGMQTGLEHLARMLGRPAYDPHGLDGVFGVRTRQAITAFQQDHGLPLTPAASRIDEIGEATIGAIVAELDRQQLSRWP